MSREGTTKGDMKMEIGTVVYFKDSGREFTCVKVREDGYLLFTDRYIGPNPVNKFARKDLTAWSPAHIEQIKSNPRVRIYKARG
jgi:hypothetical protein